MGPGVLAIAHGHDAVDDDRVDPDRILVWLFVRRGVGDGLRSEDDDIAEEAFLERAAVRDLHLRCGEARHLANRLGQREHLLVTYVVTEDARERAVRARMRLAATE